MDSTSPFATAKTTTTPELYKVFFKSYYKEKLSFLKKVTNTISVAAILFAMFSFAQRMNIFLTAIPMAVGIMLLIYPHFIYLRPYNSVKNNNISTSFEFYEDKLIEIGKGSKESYFYSDLLKMCDTDKYIFIYHNKENASVIDKSRIKGMTPSELIEFLNKKI